MQPMKVTVVGMGAVGGLLAARLAGAGHAVSALARGATLAALRTHGLRLLEGERESRIQLHATADAHELGPQQLVVIALKGPALASVAATLAPLCDAATLLLPAMNGVPWWFLQTAPQLRSGLQFGPDFRLASVDPEGRIAAALPLAQVLGCVVHLTCSSPQPGVVRHGFGDRLIVGEPGGGLSNRVSNRVSALATALTVPGLRTEASADIRSDIWFKLWGNMTLNPVSALTGASCDRILDDPLLAGFVLRCMAEAAEIGARIGCRITQSGADRLAVTRQLGAFKTSMLQDAEAGRPLELGTLVAAVHEIGERTGVAMPNIGALLGLSRLMAETRGWVPAA